MGRTCATACTNGQICGTAGTCIAEPTGQDVGTVSVTGLGPTHMLMANPVNRTYDLSITKSNFPQVPYPPFAPGAEVRLSAAGGAYSPFTLTGRGITPMQFSGTGVNVRRDNPVAITWTTPPQPEAARVLLEMDIAHHGGIAARIECDLADTGSVTIPATLITQLIERGTAGFPVITLTRLTLTSTTIQPGCVEFAVASPLEQDITVEGVTSCSGDRPCPDNRECGPDLKCLP
jgi:hypothetical protein